MGAVLPSLITLWESQPDLIVKVRLVCRCLCHCNPIYSSSSHGILQTPSTIHCIRSTLVHWVLAVGGSFQGMCFQVYFLTDEETEAWRGDSGRAYCQVEPELGAGSLAPASTLLLQFRSCSLSHLGKHIKHCLWFQSYHLTISFVCSWVAFFPLFPPKSFRDEFAKIGTQWENKDGKYPVVRLLYCLYFQMIGPSDPAVSEALLQRLPLFVLPVVSHFPRIAMETYIRQRQLIMSPLITSHVIGENEPLTSILNKVIATKEVNHKGQGTRPDSAPCAERGGALVGLGSGGLRAESLDSGPFTVFLWCKTDPAGDCPPQLLTDTDGSSDLRALCRSCVL